ncbi:putative 3-deoxy-D-arabino-heptulosonate 7-phosphate synthase isoenzyme [Tilletiopsis washingtonensis]|uniref:3-deoxy-7-phosphoheptulonate synthase n=1 Tax=Tilletiopsis washingtonensis TaxID=58919 RepID=A0A316ZB12_9BASI|nr:putative 3-deoxy-D-arabino-heptulosonate 7-phosphate synthase isoenzyme [Tilletiopsis washingtonensis]PWN98729.1 putative 3-deoxy-D-arabino-heptulosonate 7-phosphate synthase isoenzyme [Tilletiopsis washingtonensis]
MTSSPHAHVALRDALSELDDRRIRRIKPLLPPQLLVEEYPLTLGAAQTVVLARTAADAIVHGTDDRLLVIVGPCSVHDVRAGLEYARLLRAYADRASADLLIIMRVYFEKPRTTVGWKGLINDPNLDGSFAINKGLRLARGLLLELANMGLPAGTEFLDTISPQYTADLIAWGAIGARTTESQVHRELASGLSMPIGFKNGTDGSISVAVDAIKSSSSPHCFLSVTKQGLSAIVETEGNDACHVILRGANSGPNYSPEHVASTTAALRAAKLPERIMVDCSHGNSLKKHENQMKVVDSLQAQLSDGTEASWAIVGAMIESNLVEGKQAIPDSGPSTLTYGQSVTDACINWATTEAALEKLRAGVRARREKAPRLGALPNRATAAAAPGPNDAFLAPKSKGGFNDDVLLTLGKA